MKSKTQLKKQAKRKTEPLLVETLRMALLQKAWFPLASLLSGPTRKYTSVNLDELEKKTKEGDTVVVPGKVLGAGEISKKIRVCALGFSNSAREKLKRVKGEVILISEEIKQNPKAQGVKIIS